MADKKFDADKQRRQWKLHLLQKNISEWNKNDKELSKIIGLVKTDHSKLFDVEIHK